MPLKLFVQNSNQRLQLETGNGSSGGASFTTNNSFAPYWGVWSYVAVHVNRSAGTAANYLNGNDITNDTTIRNDFQTTSAWRIGSFATGGFWFNGPIDEPRVSTVTRSADWIMAQYLSMTDAFITYTDAP